MKIEYVDKYDLLYIQFDESEHEVINQRVNEHIVFDIGRNNKIVGIEIHNAKEVLNFTNLLPINYMINGNEEKLIA
jgi:uncharacterized protein YuzE